VFAAGLLCVDCGRGAPAPPPDIVLITIDTLRADRVGAFGGDAAVTPVLDRLAAAGTRFAAADATVPLTLPSHASLLTARTPLGHGVRDNIGYALGRSHATVAERLHEHGYKTAAFISAYPLLRRYGLDRGFDVYDDRLTGGGDRARPEPVERRGDETVAAAAAWLRQQGAAGQPLFLWVHLFRSEERRVGKECRSRWSPYH